MTALELYQQDERERTEGQPSLSRRAYFAQLRDALSQELSDDGFSPLLETICVNDRGDEPLTLYVLDYAALMECHSLFVGGHPLRDASEQAPHLLRRDEPVTWAEIEASPRGRIRVSPEKRNKIHELRSVAKTLHHARTDSVDFDDTSSRQAVEQAEGVALLLNARCAKLEEENRALKERIEALEKGLLDENLQTRLQARFDEESAAIRAEQTQQRAAAREEFRAQYALELADLRTAQGLQTASALTENESYRAVRQEMAESLQELRAQLTATAERWQRGLDRSEYRLLALCFCQLHTLLTATVDTVAAAAESTDTPSGVRIGLREIQRQSAERLRQMEQALFRLGMRVLRPQTGDAYDPALHTDTAVADGGGHGEKIAQAVRPGVLLIATGEALVPAEVTLE